MFLRAVLSYSLGSGILEHLRGEFLGGENMLTELVALNERLLHMNGRIRFPTVPVKAIPRRESTYQADQNPPVILVVDDERVIADTLAVILGENGFAAKTAYDGPSALEMATMVSPQLLISDVMMPGMSGIDLAIAVRHAVPDCQVLLFSGQASTSDLLRSARLAGHDFVVLTKPIHPTEMLARVSERLGLRNSG